MISLSNAGEEGVRLAEEDASLAAQSRGKTGEITSTAQAIQPHLPVGMNLDQFIALAPDPDIDVKIVEQERTVEAVRQAQQIHDRPGLAEIRIPALPEEFLPLLSKTLDGIAEDAETLIRDHLAAHGMDAQGGNWIAEGLQHTGGGTCPFCAQDIDGLHLIGAYRAVFSEQFRTMRNEISVMRSRIVDQLGERAIGRMNTLAEQNRAGVEFWSRYCDFDAAPLEFSADIAEAVRSLAEAALRLLERKQTVPLESVPRDEAFKAAVTTYEAAKRSAEEIFAAIRAVNELIAAKKQQTSAADVRAAEAELARRRATKVRHAESVARLCAQYVRLKEDKDNIENRKQQVRVRLNEHTGSVVAPYEQRINDYLDAFNASFRITQTRHGYPGGSAASSYQIVINDTTIDIGDGLTPPDRPSFKNTLSSGDRATLALAFFLAHLESHGSLAAKIVVFDDPFNSQDSFRRRQTVHEIAKVARRCAQVIVLSHDATFLKQVWDKVPAAERVALSLADHRAQGSKIVPVDLERACQGRTAIDIDDLQTYLATGVGNFLDLIRKIRAVLETYCWTTYPALFLPGQDWLGEIARKIREGGDQHPAWDLYDQLDQINDYTSQYYHGEDVADATPDQIDPYELTGYVRRTLRVVNALQA